MRRKFISSRARLALTTFQITEILKVWRDEGGLADNVAADLKEWLGGLRPVTKIQTRAIVFAQSGLNLLRQKLVKRPTPPWTVNTPVLPKVFQTISDNRGTQIATNLFAMDVVISGFFVFRTPGELTSIYQTSERAQLARRLFDISFAQQIGFLNAYLRAANDCLGVFNDRIGVEKLLVIALVYLHGCRRKIPWEFGKELTQPIRREVVGLLEKMPIDQTDARAYYAPRVELLLRLFEEVRSNLRGIEKEKEKAALRAAEAEAQRQRWRQGDI